MDRLKAELDAAGVRTWLDRESLRSGENWEAAVQRAIREASFFVACFSANLPDEETSEETSEMYEELRQAITQLRKRGRATRWFQSAMLDDVPVTDLPVSETEHLDKYHQARLYENWPAGIERLAGELNADASARRRERRVARLEPIRPPDAEPTPAIASGWKIERTSDYGATLVQASVGVLTRSPTEPVIMTAGRDLTELWTCPDLDPLEPRRHAAPVETAAFSPRGLIATATADRLVHLWRPGEPDEPPLDHVDTLDAQRRWNPKLSFSVTGEQLAVGSAGELRVWDTATGTRVERAPAVRFLTAIAFGPYERLLAFGDIHGHVGYYDVMTRREIPGHSHPRSTSDTGISQVVFSPDGSRLVSVARNHTLRVSDVDRDSEIKPLRLDGVRAVAFGPSAALLAAAQDDGRVVFLDLYGGDEPFAPLDCLAEKMAFSPDGELLATIEKDGPGRLWHIASGVQTPLDDERVVRHVVFAPDGGLLVAAGPQPGRSRDEIRVWSGVAV